MTFQWDSMRAYKEMLGVSGLLDAVDLVPSQWDRHGSCYTTQQ